MSQIEYIDYKQLPKDHRGQIRLYDQGAFKSMHKAGQLAAQCLDELAYIARPGLTTMEIDKFVFEFAIKNSALPATLNYRGYKYSCCTSINHVVCHGMPENRRLKSGDIINIDVTFIVNGWHGDSSRMYPIGTIKPAARRLLDTTHECLMQAIEIIKPGITTGDIGHVIQNHAEANRCSVVLDFCGHGIGQLFHDWPNIMHYGSPASGIELKEGMIFTIEPMINLGRAPTKILADGWTAVTRDKSLSAQYEHMIGVTKNGCEVFTLSPKKIFYL